MAVTVVVARIDPRTPPFLPSLCIQSHFLRPRCEYSIYTLELKSCTYTIGANPSTAYLLLVDPT
jgi:hypothetical protein